jgi:DNA-binding response OmpR family regulator
MRKHILVVDDNSDILSLNVFLLSRAWYEVSQAEDGQQALELILEAQSENKPFDLLLTDLKMPVMSGIELVHEIKKKAIPIPIIVLSGQYDQKLIKHLLENGCSDFFLKPYDFEKLIERVKVILGQEKKGVLRPSMSIVEMA